MANSLTARSERAIRQVRNRAATLRCIAYRQIPVPAALAGLSYTFVEGLGERATSTRKRQLSLLSLGVLMMMVGPAAAQQGGGGGGGGGGIGCGSGPLSFLSDLYSLVTKSAGMIIVSMVILAGVLKMLPMRGTNSWGNALVGSVIVGLVFLVLGPALVNIADQSTDAVNMNAQCAGGGGGGGGG